MVSHKFAGGFAGFPSHLPRSTLNRGSNPIGAEATRDEDYHISRFFQFTENEGHKYSINGFSATHVVIEGEIESIL